MLGGLTRGGRRTGEARGIRRTARGTRRTARGTRRRTSGNTLITNNNLQNRPNLGQEVLFLSK